jgi:hypothetical protein
MNEPTHAKDPDIEYSPLCEKTTRGKITIDVQIYRIAGSSEGWSLEIIDDEGSSTVFDDLFATDVAAYAEFERTIMEEGIESFLSGQQ